MAKTVCEGKRSICRLWGVSLCRGVVDGWGVGVCSRFAVINGLMAHTRQMNVASDQKVMGSQDNAPFLSPRAG